MGFFDDLKDDAVLEAARDDWIAARDSRTALEERKLKDYRLYRQFRDDLPRDASGQPVGPFGWSSLSVPLVFWIVETILPRVGIQLPTINVKPRNPAAVPYATAKQLRLRRQWQLSGVDGQLFMAIKSVLLMGDGVLKEFWDSHLGGPAARYVSWFDFFSSPEAENYRDAEFYAHRTWHTPRSLQQLAKRDASRRDAQGKKLPPLYDQEALQRVIEGSLKRDAGDDDRWQEIREAGGYGPASFPTDGGQVGIVELHYIDGSMVTIAADRQPVLLRVEREPLFRDQWGRPFRPFTVLQNTPDLFTPNAVSSAETLGDFQHEISTLTNQAIDQVTRNINAPRGIDDTMVDSVSEVIAAFGTPGGVFRTRGNPREAVHQFQPGTLTNDYERMDASVRNQAQLVSGVSDIAAGQMTPGGLQNETALGASIIREESNMRFRLLLSLLERGVSEVACHFDYIDRQMSKSPVATPLPSSGEAEGADGVSLVPGIAGWGKVDASVNGPGIEYQVEVAAGTLAPPNESEEARKVRALVTDVLAFPPPQVTGVAVNWMAFMSRLIEAQGEDPEQYLQAIPPQALLPPPAAGGPGGPPPDGPPPDPAVPVPGPIVQPGVAPEPE